MKIKLIALFVLAFLSILIYLIVRIGLFIFADYHWYEKILGFFLLAAECFLLIHTLGYFLNIFHVKKSALPTAASGIKISEEAQGAVNKGEDSFPTVISYPPIAIVLPSYREPIPIIHDTLICFYNLSYPNKHLYFLDDTRYDIGWDTAENMLAYRHAIEELCEWLGVNLFRAKWHGAKAGMLNDFIKFLAGDTLEGFEYYPYEKKEKKEAEKYLIVFDADMNPIPDFVENLVAAMEKRPRAAFVQTPQYYSNFERNRVARAAGLQQAIFYEYICEGKSLRDAMFCCGTNVVLRLEALRDVGGFDETSVTEDFATSLKFHMNGWESLYINRVATFGLGPESLEGYFKQQFRWARGTVGILRKLPRNMFLNFRKFSLDKWWEYFLSCTHYFVGWAFFIMVLFPLCFIFFKIPSYFASPEIYFLTFTPYILISTIMFFWTLNEKRYKPIDLILALLISAVAFPVYMKASASALLGINASFGITPKGEKSSISPLSAFIPQISLALLSFAAVVWGLQRLYYERDPFFGLIINIVWSVYNFIIISSFLYLNHSTEREGNYD